jgi:transposase-like protein
VSETGREYWTKLIAEQEASEHKVRPFCREHGIEEHSFYYWRRRLRENRTVRFAVLDTRKANTEPPAALELVLSSGERLRIGAGVDAATLRLVLDTIRG